MGADSGLRGLAGDRRVRILGAVLLWALLFGPALTRYAANAGDPLLFTDDARQQIWPLFPDSTSGFRDDDTIRDYYRRVVLPSGFRALYSGTSLVADPAIVSKILPVVLLLVLLVLCARTALLAGGVLSMAATGMLVLSSGLPLAMMAGGLPRAFALPLSALVALGALTGRVVLVAAATVLSAAFYPALTLWAGLALGSLLLFRRSLSIGCPGTAKAAAGVLLLTALFATAAVSPMLWSGTQYGGRIGAGETATYPEAGSSGRYIPADRPPFAGTVAEFLVHAGNAFSGRGQPFLAPLRLEEQPAGVVAASLLIACVLGTVAGARSNVVLRRGAILIACVAAAHGIARLGWPLFYIPERHVSTPLPLLLWVLLPLAIIGVARALADRQVVQSAAVFVVTAAAVLLLGGTIHPSAGLSVRITNPGLYELLASLPSSSLIAGYPFGTPDNIPYVSRRSALITYETHQAFHRDYTVEMRRRMNGLIDAYFAVDPEPIVRLRREFGVSHLIVDVADFGPSAPWYFEPFSSRIRERHAGGRAAGFALQRLSGPEVIFREGSVAVVDLARLSYRGSAGDSW